jgi:hypothetical protein
MKILIKFKEVYGKQVAYPACDNAKLFAKLANTKTLTSEALRVIGDLGYDIECVPASVSL